MFAYSTKVWARSVIGGSLLIAVLLLLFDLEPAMLAISFTAFFMAMLVGFIGSLPNLLLFYLCNQLIARFAASVATFRVWSIASLLVVTSLEYVILHGFGVAGPRGPSLTTLVFACYLLAAILASLVLVPPADSLQSAKYVGENDILDDELDLS